MDTADVNGHSDARDSKMPTVPAEIAFDLVPQSPPLTTTIQTQSTVSARTVPIEIEVPPKDESVENEFVEYTCVCSNAVFATNEEGLSHVQTCNGHSGCPLDNGNVGMDAAVDPADSLSVDESAAHGSEMLHTRPRLWIKDTISGSNCSDDNDISGFNMNMDSLDTKRVSVPNGVRGNDTRRTRTSSRRASAGLRDLRRTDRMSPQELFQGRCQQCTMCRKPDCRKCASCLRFLTKPAWPRGVCFRKVRSEAKWSIPLLSVSPPSSPLSHYPLVVRCVSTFPVTKRHKQLLGFRTGGCSILQESTGIQKMNSYLSVPSKVTFVLLMLR